MRAELAKRLWACSDELKQTIGTRVREQVPDPATDDDPELRAGFSEAVSEVVDYSLAAIEVGGPPPGPLPAAVLEQARRAARKGMGLDIAARRFVAGYELMEQLVLDELSRVEMPERLRHELRQMVSDILRALLGGLIEAITKEHADEIGDAHGPRERRLAELVRAVLAGAEVSSDELSYRLDATHVGLIARGPQARVAIREMVGTLGCEVLQVQNDQVIWVWFGSRQPPSTSKISELCSSHSPAALAVALGEPGSGPDGFRRTHDQAQDMSSLALLNGRVVTRYADAAILAAVRKDNALETFLIEKWVRPLDGTRSDGEMLRRTLTTYFETEGNVVSTASALNISRGALRDRLAKIKECIGAPVTECEHELNLALQLETLRRAADRSIRTNQGNH